MLPPIKNKWKPLKVWRKMKKKNTDYTDLECQNNQTKKIYSDLNAILTNIGFISPKNVSRKKEVITRKRYKKSQTII